ncbi:unnamed protein product [Adineta steineri]|uniref:F-box domain-containing protein n=1 Tax=Adineta steineri TaxID=433720 RepID=A0A814UYQ5_9BILA|nr:unnamed protein product [Adineta steineri]CAF1414953.1 unnamed protein product [Adineta steineri]
MNGRTVHLLDLPDEILLIILKKLGSVDVLYSLLNINKRLDQMARSVNNTKFLNFSMNNVQHNRFCCEILPQIHHNIVELTLELFSMECILLACKYPNLTVIVLTNFSPDILLEYLTDESPISHLFQQQIRHLTITSEKEICTSRSFTDVCIRILAMCRNLSYLNMNQWLITNQAYLSIRYRPPNVCFSPNLHTLSINVIDFDDCLRLLDGRLEQLRSFTVRIYSIKRSMVDNNNQKILFNLKEFSLTSYLRTYAYDCRILSLLRRMSNLETLALSLDIERLTVIDGLHLNKELLIHMTYLNKFRFHICTVLRTSETNYFLTTNDIKSTFLNWKYSSVSCCIDHFSSGYSHYHIYSTPFQMTHFMYLSNNFRGHYLLYVTNLKLYDTRPFEHDFFEWIPQACPLLKHLIVNNSTPQKNKRQVTIIDDKQIFSTISYLHLFKLSLLHAHVDYVDQFLCYTNMYVPTLHTLSIQYDNLVTISDNFTNDPKQINCSQIKQIVFGQLIVLPKDFYDYFLCLEK